MNDYDDNDLIDGHLLGAVTVNQYGERFLFNLNRHAFDKVGAFALYEAQFGERLARENTLHVIVGTDSGLLPRYIAGRPLPKGSRFIFVEPESVLSALQQQELLVDCGERIACVRIEDWPQALREFKVADYLYINAVHSFNSFCAQDDFINEYAELSWTIVDVLTRLNWENNVAIGQEAFIDRQIMNVADNKLPAKILQNHFSGCTVVILGGGPSLDEALSWIKGHREQIIIFAVSRISRQLIAADIEPDFVFSVDPHNISFDVSKEMLLFGERTVFVSSYHTETSLVNQWQGTMLYLGPRLPWETDLNCANLAGAGPTVTNAALSVAYDFGFNRIILAGVDLCFTRDGFTHAKGSNEQLAGPKLDLTSVQVETNAGYMAPTDSAFAQAAKGLSFQAKRIVAKGGVVINCSLGAAKIEGITYQALNEISIAENADFSGRAANSVMEKISAYTLDNNYLDQVLAELRRAEFQINAISRLAKRARRINDTMYNHAGVLANYKDKKEIDRIEKKFKREHRDFSKLVKRYGIRQFLQVIMPFTDEDWSFEETRQLGNLFYDAYLEGAEKLLKLIGDAISRVEVRQLEESPSPDFERFFQQWRQDKSYARAKIWRNRHSGVTIPSHISARLEEFTEQFCEILNRKDTQHLANMKARSKLGIVRQRAGLLFKHGKSESLRDLLASLDKHNEREAAEVYRYLIQGYVAELDGQPDIALAAYQQIIDTGDNLLEDALLRVAGLSIQRQDTHTVALALECLSRLNPVYLPFYAEVQRISGDSMAAIDAYSQYIAEFPADLLVQLKLVMLYIECKIFDGAQLMLDFILQQKPGYEPAVAIMNQLAERRLKAG